MSSNSSNSSNEGGNTITPSITKKKQISPAKRWCFTLNNYTELDISSIVPQIKTLCNIAIVAKEVGQSGTPHLQGYLEFKTKCRPKSRFTNRIHWEKCKGNREENITYCRKDNNILLMLGIDKPYTIELDLYEWQKQIVKVLDGPINDRYLYWYWEETGCAGKTTFCKWIYTHYDDVVVLSGKAADMKHGIVQFKETTGRLPKIILIDMPRSTNLDFLSYQGIEEVKDMFFFSGKYEGGMICGAPPHLIIFSNEEPNYSKCSADRWMVTEL